jgi:hypothetical protein
MQHVFKCINFLLYGKALKLPTEQHKAELRIHFEEYFRAAEYI